MYKRILVPLDGSRFSEEIIPYAAGLAAVHDTELTLLRVVDNASRTDEAAAYVEQLASAWNARSLCVLAPGDIAQAVLKESDHTPGTLLAMTSRGHSGLAEVLLGSVAQRIMRNAGGPVLMYHPDGKHDRGQLPVQINRVMLALDGGTLSETMSDDAARFAHWIGADLEVVSVIGSPSAAEVGNASTGEMTSLESSYVRSRATQLGKQHGVEVNWDVLHGDPAEAISEHVGSRHDIILAMTTRRQDALEAAILGSVAAGCLRTAGVPVLMRLP
ncbi:MAG TPA: universal stress protein [Castellaniella sp.]|jgi:nucleotide-binding universal stress UspA family protein|nr:universal stress protein [Castellaniella sp.]